MDHEDIEVTSARAVSQVLMFHRNIGAPICMRPTMPECDAVAMTGFAEKLRSMCEEMKAASVASNDHQLQRAAMAAEEFSEWLEALAAGDLVGAADAFADRLFLLLGDAVSMGLPVGKLFQEVSRSNATKARLIRNGYGKGVKGKGFKPPEIARVLEEHRKQQEQCDEEIRSQYEGEDQD